MPIKILMPALSPTMESGTIIKWLKKEGDIVKAGEVIVEIETDKATMELEAVDEGIIAKILVQAGTNEVRVGTLIAVLIDEGEDATLVQEFIASNIHSQPIDQTNGNKSTTQQNHNVASTEPLSAEQRINLNTNIDVGDTHKAMDDATSKKIYASPLAKRIASNANINLAHVQGSGPHGRIVKSDILSFLAKHANQDNTTAYPQAHPRHIEEYTIIPHTSMRKTIAKRLVESKTTIPHFYLSATCLMDKLLAIRAEINNSYGEDKEAKLSINDFIITAVAKALQKVPTTNSSWCEEGVKVYHNIDIAIAVSIEGGLVTPVIRNADQKNITTISSEMKQLATKARANLLKPHDFQGSSFTISNLGMYGITSFSAIINPPQSCILAVGMCEKRAVVVDDQIVARSVLDVNLSCDHRVIDGAVGAQFLAAFKQYIESPILMFC